MSRVWHSSQPDRVTVVAADGIPEADSPQATS